MLKCERLPRTEAAHVTDVEALFTDDRMLIAEFAKLGVAAESVVWSDPELDWEQFDIAFIRSTWDYIERRDHFLSVLAEIHASPCLLLNPLDIVRWNSEKSYLADLAKWQVPIVPTLWGSAQDASVVQQVCQEKGWETVVIKPAIGAGGAGFRIVPATDLPSTLGRVQGGEPDTLFLVQPLVESVRTEGEWGYVFIEGDLSHVLLKTPATGDYRTHSIHGGRLECVEPDGGDRRQAQAIMARLPFRPLYARLDLVRVDGRLAVMELELVEPMLYFDLAPRAAARLANASVARLQRAPR